MAHSPAAERLGLPLVCVLVGVAIGVLVAPELRGAHRTNAPLRSPRILAEAPAASGVHVRGEEDRLPMCAEPVSILSLDGGGMRGLIGATVLEDLEAILSEKEGQPVSVGDYFDVVVGTSTGGLQAASLALGHQARQLAEIYERDGAKIFNNDMRNCKPHYQQQIREHCSLNLYDLLGLLYDCLPAVAHCYLSYPVYDSSGIEAVARSYLGDMTTADDFGGRVLGMTTYDLLRGSPVTFSNLGATPASTYYLTDAVLATSAAPTFFNPHNMTCVGCSEDGDRLLGVDGALYANNPSLIAYELAEKMAVERRGCQLTHDRSLMLSLGTGRERSDLYASGNVDLRNNMLGSAFKTVVQFLEFNDTTWWDTQWGTLKWVFLPLTVPRLELLGAAIRGQEELTDQFFRKVFHANGAVENYMRVQVDLSRFEHSDSFGGDARNVELLRAVGAEAAASTRIRLVRFADELIAARAQRPRGSPRSHGARARWGGLRSEGPYAVGGRWTGRTAAWRRALYGLAIVGGGLCAAAVAASTVWRRASGGTGSGDASLTAGGRSSLSSIF